MNKQQTLARIAWGICILIGIVLSFKALREPDLWWMYRTGEWMLENGAVTKADPFSYTFEGVEWINVKWLFEVIIATGKNWFGVEFIFAFQALVTVLLLTFLYQSANLIRRYTNKNSAVSKTPFAGLIIAAFLMLYTIDYRLIGRPEMTSHALTAAYLFLFWKYYYEPSKLIFVLIPLQIFWTNMHEAFGIGMILMLAYLGASWVHYFYAKQQNSPIEAPKWLSMAVGGAIIGIVINPRGFQMLLHPFEIFGQLENNQYTTELASIWKVGYWEGQQAYLNLLFLVGALLLVILTPFLQRKKTTPIPSKASTKDKKKIKPQKPKTAPLNWFKVNVQQYGMGNGLLFFMLFYLSTTAYRNIPFFILAAAPLLAVGIEQSLKRFQKAAWLYPLLIGVGIAFYGSVITGKYHDWSNSKDQYGLQVLASHNPTGAAQFIKDKNIEGRCFSDYLTSAYLLWDLQPEFKTYIDLRDLDIFTSEFFLDFAQVTTYPEHFDAKDDSLNFDYIVLYRPQFIGLHQHLLQSPNYDLVFVDPVACVYLKNTEKNAPLIEQYGFIKNGRQDIFAPLQAIKASSVTYGLSKIFNPLYTPSDYSNTNIDAVAGSYYFDLGMYDLALARGNKAIQNPAEPWRGYELLANTYSQLVFAPQTADSLRTNYDQQALYYYDQAIQQNPAYISAIVNKGIHYIQKQDFNTAIHLFSTILEQEKGNSQAIQYLGLCYKFLSNQDARYAQQWLDYRLQLNAINPNNPVILLDIGLAHCYLKNCAEAKKYLHDIMTTPNLPSEELRVAKQCLNNCGM